MKTPSFFDQLDAHLEEIFGKSGAAARTRAAAAAIKDPTVFDDTRLNNLQTTIKVLIEDHQDELEVLKAPISYIGEDGTWRVTNLPVAVLNEVFAQELSATDSLAMVIGLYTEDLEKKFKAK